MVQKTTQIHCQQFWMLEFPNKMLVEEAEEQLLPCLFLSFCCSQYPWCSITTIEISSFCLHYNLTILFLYVT